MINFFAKDVNFSIQKKAIYKKWLNEVILIYGFKAGEINIIFCSDSYILEINSEFLNHNYYTDIITFDYSDDNILSGELYISIDTVLLNSKKYKQTFENELNRVIVHGVLHLCGLNDHTKSEKIEMRHAEDNALIFLTKFFNPDSNE